MARPLRIEFPGALYHVTTRGDRREAIFEDNADRKAFLAILEEVVARHNWLCHAYCLMGNHYHLVVETPDGNLSRGMRQLNGMFTQASNRRHRRVGHLFQGRYKAILVDKDAYLLELVRYVVLNPVRAGLVTRPGKYAWSSYRATAGEAAVPGWLAADAVLALFAKQRAAARRRYVRFVADGIGEDGPWDDLRQQIYLGDAAFVERMQGKAAKAADGLSVPKVQRRKPAPPLHKIMAAHADRNDAIAAAYATGAYSYREIAEHLGIHLATVGRVVRSRMLQCET